MKIIIFLIWFIFCPIFALAFFIREIDILIWGYLRLEDAEYEI